MLDPSLWRPAFRALRDGMPDDVPLSTFSGSISAPEMAGSVMDRGEKPRPRLPGGRRVLGALGEVAAIVGGEHLGVLLTSADDGTDTLTVWRWPESVRGAGIGHELELVLVPGAWPEAQTAAGSDPDAPGRLTVHGRSGTTVADAHQPGIVEVQVGAVAEPVDLSPLAGHLRLRSLSAVPASVTGIEVVAWLTALRHLSLGRHDWRRLIDEARVPPGLVAAGVSTFGDADVGSCLGVANELLARWGAPMIEPRSTTFRAPA